MRRRGWQMSVSTADVRTAGHGGTRLTRTRTERVLVLIISLVLVGGGCAGFRHGYTLDQFQGQVLRVKGGGPGAERLRIESDYDASVRNFVAQNDAPDYLFVGDRSTLYLIYL